MARSTRSAVSALTYPSLLPTRDTVWSPTCASSATSFMVGLGTTSSASVRRAARDHHASVERGSVAATRRGLHPPHRDADGLGAEDLAEVSDDPVGLLPRPADGDDAVRPHQREGWA